jgi:Electron transfer DM13
MVLTERPSNRSEQPRQLRRRIRVLEFVPELLLAVGLTVFLIDEPDAATSAFNSSRALAMMAMAAIGWVAARLAFARLVPWRLVRLATFGLAAVAVLAVVVVPAYDNDTVVERFPVASSSSPAAPPQSADDAAGSASGQSATTVPDGPVRLRVGSFRGVDHRASGVVAVYRQPDGHHVVGLEDIDIQPGPDYDVYVVPGEDREDRHGGTRLDDLRGNQGTQFYDVPPEIDLSAGAWSVLVWCQTFGVPIATATPS